MFNMRKKQDESLRDYIKMSPSEKANIVGCDDRITSSAFKKGLPAEHDLYRELTITLSQTLYTKHRYMQTSKVNQGIGKLANYLCRQIGQVDGKILARHLYTKHGYMQTYEGNPGRGNYKVKWVATRVRVATRRQRLRLLKFSVGKSPNGRQPNIPLAQALQGKQLLLLYLGRIGLNIAKHIRVLAKAYRARSGDDNH
ncbi:unnamed protein product [Prunus brigantina]